MRYAEVSVNSPAAQRRTFSYAVPAALGVEAGQTVWVPFGHKLLQGVVLELTDHPGVEEVREIAGTIDPHPVLSSAQISLARWISQHYLAPLFDCVALMLTPGFRRRTVTFVSASSHDTEAIAPSERQRQVLEMVRQRGRVSLSELEKALGKASAQRLVAQLVGRGLVARSYEPAASRVKPKTEPHLRLSTTADRALEEAAQLHRRRASKQAALLEFLARQSGAVTLAEARQKTQGDRTAANALARKGLVSIEQTEVRRQPFAHQGITPSAPLPLTPAQDSAFSTIQARLRAPAETGGAPPVFLLHGVTGSGKTEVYLQALAEAVRLGKRGIVLVPEIALTPQTVERFAARFPNRVAVLHSRLSTGERYDEWRAIREGKSDVVIGPRSAVFAPLPDLGLLIIDEEHEWSYKQQELLPYYHARDAAIRLAGLDGAVVVLGSATPDVESYYRARRGDYRLLELPERVTPGEKTMPGVTVVDLRAELKAGNRSIFSRALHEAIESVLANGEQAILFLNRRGTASSVQCRSCGHVVTCPNCDIPLSYHSAEGFLLCHQCNYRALVPQVCPRCGSRRIKYLGLGTQRLELETRRAFPQARLLRWDSDVTRGKHSHQEILDRFRNHEADILIGTQMVAKGLDLPRVTLVGVIIADTGLSFPDFRAGERTFQLLCQVSGRAGRGVLGGQVIVQTYSPEHYTIRAAAGHDYALFYQQEIAYRRQLHDPPFSELARLTYSHANDARCRQEAERMRQSIIAERDARGMAAITLIGPAPAFIHRRRGQFRWQLILRGPDLSAFLAPIPIPQGWTVDIDPIGL